MPTGSDIARKAYTCIENNWGYIWGQAGAVWTQEMQNAATRDMTKKYGAKWIGHHVADCSGLVVWVCRQYGIPMYHGSNTMYVSEKYLTGKGELKDGRRADGAELKAGSLVFKYNGDKYYHVGIWDGEKVIEAQGTQAGCVTSALKKWTHWGEIRGVDYTGEQPGPEPEPTPARPTLRKGSRGDLVTTLQQMLDKAGYSPGKIDGIFGTNTEKAVRQFQSAHGLTADGVCGPRTWAALDSAAPLETYRVTATGVTWAQYRQILAICPLAEAVKEVD